MSKPTHTPAPWHWELDEQSKGIKLKNSKGFCVMRPRRWGMQSATLDFIRRGIMHGAIEFAKVVPGREHHERWFKTIDHPDANLIAAAPDMLEALECQIDYERWDDMMPNISHSEIQNFSDKWELRWREVLEIYPDIFFDRLCLKDLANELRRRAIAKAKGEADG